MYISDKDALIQKPSGPTSLLDHFAREVTALLSPDEWPVRFVVTGSGPDGYRCEIGTLTREADDPPIAVHPIFGWRRRTHESPDPFGVAMVIPTGVNCEIGGHSGDACAAARLIASCCDRLILHPNVVNASDINELPDNALYVEGSVLTRLLMGTAGLLPVRSNRVLLVVDIPERTNVTSLECYINAFSAARVAIGMHEGGVHCLAPSYEMRTIFSPSGRASGRIDHLDRLLAVLDRHEDDFDALALASIVDIPDGLDSVADYFTKERTNPWGGVEAMLTHAVSLMRDIPSAHAPMVENQDIHDLDIGIVDPRKAAEAITWTDLFCVLKGLHRAPRIITDPVVRTRSGVINAENIACLVQPEGCLGLPTLAALEQGMTVIAVRENRTLMTNRLTDLPFRTDRLYVADNYIEAAGLVSALRAGIDPGAVRRPVSRTQVWNFPKK